MCKREKPGLKGRLPKILGKAVLVVLFILILAVNIIPEFSEELFGKKGPPEIFKTPTPTVAKWGFFLGILGIIALIVVLPLTVILTLPLFDKKWYELVLGLIFVVVMVGFFFDIRYTFICVHVLGEHYRISNLSYWVYMGVFFLFTLVGVLVGPVVGLIGRLKKKFRPSKRKEEGAENGEDDN